jgi:hypothetical protein
VSSNARADGAFTCVVLTCVYHRVVSAATKLSSVAWRE